MSDLTFADEFNLSLDIQRAIRAAFDESGGTGINPVEVARSLAGDQHSLPDLLARVVSAAADSRIPISVPTQQ